MPANADEECADAPYVLRSRLEGTEIAQIKEVETVDILRQAEDVRSVLGGYREHGPSEATYDHGKFKIDGVESPDGNSSKGTGGRIPRLPFGPA